MSMQQKSEAESSTLIQRVTRIFRKGNKTQVNGAEVEKIVKPVETEEQKQQRLEAYQKMCAEESVKELENAANKNEKAFKFRAKDFNH